MTSSIHLMSNGTEGALPHAGSSSPPTRLMVVLGTRPEAIKLAPIIIAARTRANVEVVVCNTGQHRDLVGAALSAFNVKANIDLDIMSINQTLTDVTTAVLTKMAPALEQVAPHWVIVQGDTTTALSAALAAFYARIPVAHVEAGLRTHDINAPWPEEMNRRLVSALTTLHFVPTSAAAENLKREGVASDRVIQTGNTVVDAVRLMESHLRNDLEFRAVNEAALRALGVDATRRGANRIVLITCHRRESFGSGLQQICEAIRILATNFGNDLFVFPQHPNPQLRAAVTRHLRAHKLDNLLLIEPLDYVPFILLMMQSSLLLTDSGGLQEEGISLGKRVAIMRDVTERPEAVETGLARIAGTATQSILATASAALNEQWSIPASFDNPFGNGKAAEIILSRIQSEQVKFA